jgi:hypothetical protein
MKVQQSNAVMIRLHHRSAGGYQPFWGCGPSFRFGTSVDRRKLSPSNRDIWPYVEKEQMMMIFRRGGMLMYLWKTVQHNWGGELGRSRVARQFDDTKAFADR